MNSSRAKAIITRTQRLSEQFKQRNGRMPTLEELGILYSMEMSNMARTSNKPGQQGYFAQVSKKNPELFKQHSAKGGVNKKGWRKDGQKDREGES